MTDEEEFATVTAFSTFVRTRALIRICPGLASSHRREATLETVPMASSSAKRRLRTISYTPIRFSPAPHIDCLWATVSSAIEDAKSAWVWRFRTKFIGMGYYFL